MRAYLLEDIAPEATENLAELLKDMDLQSPLAGVFWLPVPEVFYTEEQKAHAPECGPYVMALEIEQDSVKLEFLVRAQNALHCSCVGYASPDLEQHMMRYAEQLLTDC